MRRQKNCDSTTGYRQQEVAYGVGGYRIDALEWFIQKKNWRIMQQCQRQCGFLAHPMRALIQKCVTSLVKSEPVPLLDGPGFGFRCAQSIDWSGEHQMLIDRQRVEEAQAF